MKIPDYISPIVGYRVSQWNAAGLKSLNGEPWLPGRPLAAGCRAAAGGTHVKALHGSHELPHSNCTCGVYAAKSIEHLRQVGYERRGIHGEAFLWGTVVEHRLGWRAQFAYPKSLFLPADVVPFTLAEIDSRLKTLITFGVDIFIVGDRKGIRLWTNGSALTARDWTTLSGCAQKHYARQQQERMLKKGDRVALLGRGIAVVEQADEKETVVVLGSRHVLRIARKDIVLNQQNLRWERGIRSQLLMI